MLARSLSRKNAALKGGRFISGERYRRLAIPCVVWLAGFTFLLYEVSWNRLLALRLGSTVGAATLVLAAFMAGFGIGAFAWGKRANASRRPDRLLGFLFAGIALLGALVPLLISRAIPALYAALGARGYSAGSSDLIAFVVAAALLFCGSFLMGGVFPLVCRTGIGPEKSIPNSIGRLYAIETLGSAVGGLATGFILLGLLGQSRTIALAIVVDLALAVFVLAARHHQVDDNVGSGHAESAAELNPSSPSRRNALLGAFACGFAILGLQVVWMRMLRIYLTNTSYTFALVSSLSILGLFVGSALFERRGGDPAGFQRTLLRSLLLLGAAAGLGLLLLAFLPQLIMFPFREALGNPLLRVFLLPVVAGLLVVFPPAVASGYAFPLACSIFATKQRGIGGDVGFVLMVNTAGAIVGPVVVAFLLLPRLGAMLAALALIALLALTSLILARSLPTTPSLRRIKLLLYAVVGVLAAMIIWRPEVRILPPSFARLDREVLFYRESTEGTLAVGQSRGAPTASKHTYVNNSAVIGSSYDAVKIVKMVGHFPFLIGTSGEETLVIGFGIGVTTSAIASHASVKSIDCVELVEGLLDAAVYYEDLNRGVAQDPRLRLIPGDGRHHLQRTAKRYDLISCDPTHPILGSGNLYTRDYFELCREHLKPGGVVSQYLPLHKLRQRELLGIIATFHSVFPDCTVWLGHSHAMLLGALAPISIDYADWRARLEEIGGDSHFYLDPHHLAATLALSSETIAALSGTSELNTDDRSYTEFFAPACLDDRNLAANLGWFIEHRSDIDAVFRNIDDPALMGRFVRGNRMFTESLMYRLRGENQRSLHTLQRAARANPEDREYPFLIELLY